MGWYIFGVIALCIVLFLLKHSYFNRNKIYEKEQYEMYGRTYKRKGKFIRYEYTDKFKMPLWLFVLIIIVSFIPILNIIGFFVAMFLILGGIAHDELFIHFENTTIWHKIGKFFNKKVF